MRNRIVVTVLCVAAMLGVGCQHYQVTDVGSGKTYYTNNWDSQRYVSNGTVVFEDHKTGALITLPASEIRPISKDEYLEAMSGSGSQD